MKSKSKGARKGARPSAGCGRCRKPAPVLVLCRVNDADDAQRKNETRDVFCPSCIDSLREEGYAVELLEVPPERIRAAHARATLRTFALSVLRIMEEHADWTSDTFQEINDAALAHGLCREDAAFFTRTPRGRGEEG